MTAPVIQSVQYTGTTLYIIFDRAVANVSDLSAFTFTVTPGPSVITPAFSSIDQNAVIGTLAVPIGASETLTVDYTDPGAGATQVQEAAAPNDPVATFAGEVAVGYYSPAVVRRAQVAANAVNDAVTIFFGEPVSATAGDLIDGFTIEYNDTALDLTGASASLNADQTELTILTGVNPLYSDTVDVIYSGTGELYSWPTGVVAAFTLNDIDNDSTDGLPTSAYPQSFVIKKELAITGSVVTPCLQVILNPVDIDIVKKYGLITAYTGGTFGITVGNPSGITVVGGQESIVDGAEICINFTNSTDTKYATDAATEWQNTVTDRIAVELGKLRATDQSITLANDTVEAV